MSVTLLLAAGLAGCAAPRASIDDAAVKATPGPYQAVTAEQILRKPIAAAVVELAYSARQDALFVSAPDWQDESRSRLLTLDPRTLAVQGETALAGKGFGLALDDQAGRAYLTQSFNGAISVVDTHSKQVIKQIPIVQKTNLEQVYRAQHYSPEYLDFLLGQLKRFKITDDYPHKLRELVVDAKNGRVFATGLGFGVQSVLFVIDTKTLTLEKVIPGFGYNVVGITLDEKHGRVFVSNMRGQLMTVDAKTLEITSTREIQADQLLNLVYDPTGNRLFGVDQGIDRTDWRDRDLGFKYQSRSAGHRVFALDADTGKVLADMPAGQVPIGLRFDAERQRLYVTNRGGVRVASGAGSSGVYDTAAYALLQTIALPPHPNGLALDPRKHVLYATVKNDGDAAKAGTLESVLRIDLR